MIVITVLVCVCWFGGKTIAYKGNIYPLPLPLLYNFDANLLVACVIAVAVAVTVAPMVLHGITILTLAATC